MDSSSPFNFSWGVDQSGYDLRPVQLGPLSKVEVFVVGRGGTEGRYQPLDDPALWLHFGETCRDPNGVLAFANKFGLLCQPNKLAYGAFGQMPPEPGDRLADTLEFAFRVKTIAGLLDVHQRQIAMLMFNGDRPQMIESISWRQEQPERFDYRWVPLSLRDALLHQIGDAITGDRHFRRCSNRGCSKFFRLGPHQADEGGRRQTKTVRRKFCSEYCRVAAFRRQKREAATHA